ncbi:MAG: arabinosyltransferase domain-containing protein [Pseudonocardiaceae bacterium]
MPESDTSPVPSGRARWLLVALIALTAALGMSVPLAPVHADQPVVRWPAAGQRAESTVLALAPYRPLSLEASVGCATLRELAGRPGAVDALRTVPPDAGPFDGAVGPGLQVATDRGQVVVRSSAGTVLAEPVPAGDCRYHIMADAAGVRVLRDGALVVERPDLLPPQVAELATEAPGAAGLSVVLRPDDRYASSPTTLKTGLLVAHLLALVALLALAVRIWPGRRPPDQPGLVVPRPSGADAVVVAVSAAWLVLGGVHWDDAWYLLMARNAGEAGYLGNYVYMFNAAENPFVASQYLLRGWGWAGGWELAWMRLLPLAYGLGIWVLLRILLATALGRAGRLPRVAWLLMIAHLLWWLPYGMTLRPEPLIALCTAGVLVLVELARRRRSLGVLAVATALAALTMTVSPTGAIAWAPLVMTLPWLIPLLRASGAATSVAAVLVAVVAISVVVPVGFADAGLGEVLDAGATHNWYYLTHPWYEEILHYNALLTAEAWGRRAPVVLTLAVLVLVAIASGRHRGAGDPLHRLLLAGTLTAVVALALIAISPTKWVNHFGSLGAIGTVVLTAALLRSPLPRRSGALQGAGPARGAGAARVGPVAAGAAVLTVVAAAALVYAGPNLWRPFSDWGQPFGDHLLPASALMAPHFGPIYLRNPLVWVVLAGLLAGGIAQWRRRGGRTGLTVDRGLLLVASGLSVALVVAVFMVAPLRQYPGWTVAKVNLRALSGQPCGLVDAVQVLAPTGPQPVGTGTALASGDFALAAGSPAPVRPPADGTMIWHDVVPPGHAGSARERGTLTTPWYSLPAGSPATHLTVPVAAGVIPGPQVQVQFGNLSSDSAQSGTQAGSVRSGRSQSGGGRSGEDQSREDQSREDQGAALWTVSLELDPRTRPDTWQEIPVPLEGPRPAAVRLVVRDDVTGEGSWVAVGAPSLTSWQPVATVIEGRPVFADQLSAVLWPCVDQVAIRHGIVELPAVRLLTDDGIPEFVLHNALDPLWGGTFVQAARTSTHVAMASRLHPSGPPTRHWGQVQRVVYDHPLGLVDLHVATTVEPGWHREAPVTGDAYSGRKHLE